ncbi:CGNR zinc finger domain-containing protein [Brevibacterium daeguense]|uniref:CGNR zinc finger domain-containing protein n=1 Tax=Brevibacterium daeguense TaxID=909936 RepID=A0ABP8EGL9_9MICO|nr:CGNR zinc finger domain-containing protein [Brevibacterium daeguense]
MPLTQEARVNLTLLVDLVNTGRSGHEELPDPASLSSFVRDHGFSTPASGTDIELQQVHDVRQEFSTVFEAESVESVVALVNATLLRCSALPQLVRHDDWGWHLHAVAQTAPLADRIAVDIALALVDTVREDELSRLQRCAAEDCDAVFADFSRNRSKRFCDLGNCGNRTHVAAYRRRQEEEATPGKR